jgi:hypothetical protein
MSKLTLLTAVNFVFLTFLPALMAKRFVRFSIRMSGLFSISALLPSLTRAVTRNSDARVHNAGNDVGEQIRSDHEHGYDQGRALDERVVPDRYGIDEQLPTPLRANTVSRRSAAEGYGKGPYPPL